MTDKEAIIKKRLERKAKGLTKKAMITPYPISNTIISDNVQGNVLKYMFPCKGKITKGAIDLDKKPKMFVTVTFMIENETGGSSKVFTFDRKRLSVDLDIDIEEFDKLNVFMSYVPEKSEDNLTEVSISLLWVPTIKDVEVKSFLISELEKDDA